MNNKVKKIHKINWSYLIPQLGIIALFAIILYKLGVKNYWLLGTSLYFLCSLYLKILIPKYHRKGILYLKKGKFDGALICFQKSYNYFRKYSWLDEYRAFTLMSMSKISYKEMALINMAWCYQSKGDKKNSKACKLRLNQEFPQNKNLY